MIALVKYWRIYLILTVIALLALLKIRNHALSDKLNELKQEVKAHGRINEADLGIGDSDAERIDRLRRYADRNSNR